MCITSSFIVVAQQREEEVPIPFALPSTAFLTTNCCFNNQAV